MNGTATRSKILVADDDRNMRELMALHLSNAGYEVRTAEDGIEAGYALLGQRPDLILCDINMPHMDGFQLVSAIREDPELQTVPVIFLTTGTNLEQRVRKLGAIGYVYKPIRADRLLALLAEKLRAGGAQPRARSLDLAGGRLLAGLSR